MIKIYFLGTASGIPTPQRFNTSVVLEASGNIYLFDAGEACSSLLIRNKIDYRKIRCMFISHMHTDHVSGIFQLIQTLQLSRTNRYSVKEKVINLFVPKEGIDSLKKMFCAFYLMPEILPFSLELFSISEAYFYKDSLMEVRAIANQHLKKGCRGREILQKTQTKYPNAFQSYSFLIKVQKKMILYSGDISDISELDEFLDNIDVLILELAHIDFERTIKFLSQQSISKVIFTHLHPKFDDSNKNQLNQFQVQIKKYLSDKVTIATDGLVIKV